MTEVCSETCKPISEDWHHPRQRGILHGNLVLLILHWLMQISWPPSARFWLFSQRNSFVMQPWALRASPTNVARGAFMSYSLHPQSTSPPHPSAQPFPIQESSPYWLHCSDCSSGLFSPNTLHKPFTYTGFILPRLAEKQCSGSCRHAHTAEPWELGTHKRWRHPPSHLHGIRTGFEHNLWSPHRARDLSCIGRFVVQLGATGHLHGPLLQWNREEELVESRTRSPTELSGRGQDASAGSASPGTMRTMSGSHSTSAAKPARAAHRPAAITETHREPLPLSLLQVILLPTSNCLPCLKLTTVLSWFSVFIIRLLRKPSPRTSRTLNVICPVWAKTLRLHLPSAADSRIVILLRQGSSSPADAGHGRDHTWHCIKQMQRQNSCVRDPSYLARAACSSLSLCADMLAKVALLQVLIPMLQSVRFTSEAGPRF